MERLWILKKYLRFPAGHDFRYVALKVNGYSMEPLLEEGDIVVIDRADCDMKKIHENSIYAVRKDDLYYISQQSRNQLFVEKAGDCFGKDPRNDILCVVIASEAKQSFSHKQSVPPDRDK